MRWLFITAVVATVALNWASLAVLPSPMAIHFGANGMADGWAPGRVHAILMTVVHAFIFCSIYFTPKLVLLLPARWLNLPHKEYWLQPANRRRAAAKLRDFMGAFGAGIFLFFLVVEWLVLKANLATPVRLDLRIFVPALVAFLVFTGG
jgi:uncharacterized membrane protein